MTSGVLEPPEPDISFYLDIETRSFPRLSRDKQYITVIGFFHELTGLTQMVWPEINAASLKELLPEAERVYTFNGNNFDLRFIKHHTGLDLLEFYKSRDLMYDCRSRGLRGGLKAVERQLGIGRLQSPLNNWEIQECWTRWKHKGDRQALDTLLKYNEEDVMNLVELRQQLGV
jgi:uncharacterized protein YprB with RNaseH-like and TPR domain